MKPKALPLIIVVALMSAAATPDKTVYSRASNKELSARTLRLVKEVRELVFAYKRKDRELMAEYGRRDAATKTVGAAKAAKEQWLKDSDAAHDAVMREYKEKYWAEAVLLRAELSGRLAKKPPQSKLLTLYQHPTNVLGIEAISDHLELLARSLPEK